MLGDVRGARDRLARAAVLARSDEQASVVIPTLAIRSMASAVAGDLAGADATVREAVALARDGDDPLLLAVALATLARHRNNYSERDGGAGGRRRAAARCGRTSPTRPRSTRSRPGASRRVRLEAGDVAGCRALIDPATAPEQLAQLHPLARALLLDVRIRLAVRRDDRADALAQLAALEQLGFSRQPLGAAFAGIASAFVALADDHPLNAEARATAAAEEARRASSRLLELRALLAAGRAQQALGAPDVAAERFSEAEAIARAIGASGAAARAADERRASGGVIVERPAPEDLRADAASVRDRAAGRRWRDQPRGRGGPRHLRAHRQHPPAGRLLAARRDPPHRAGDGTRAAPAGLRNAGRCRHLTSVATCSRR